MKDVYIFLIMRCSKQRHHKVDIKMKLHLLKMTTNSKRNRQLTTTNRCYCVNRLFTFILQETSPPLTGYEQQTEPPANDAYQQAVKPAESAPLSGYEQV